MRTLSLRTTVSVLAPVLFSFGVVACGGGSTTTSSSGASSGTGGGGTSSTSSGTGGAGTGGAGTGGGASVEYDAILLGTLVSSSDLAKAKMDHDAVASGAEPQAKALGDFGHVALLGTTILGTTQNQFLAVDRWNADKIDTLYNSPMFQQAFATIVSGPALEKYRRQKTWAGYGDLDTGKMYPNYYYALFQGTLKDPATAQATHDMIVAGAKDMAMMSGDVAHVAFTGRDDPTKAAFIDIWKDSSNIMAIYSSPAFAAAFAKIFAAPPTIGVYHSTDWHQW